ncbi:calcium/calmodulin-dependent protein kinase type 1 [Aphelenchoides avenae]|nr:calcium/calmodulin-dependent protein kinase type 1 [Aphelenchus avenae]
MAKVPTAETLQKTIESLSKDESTADVAEWQDVFALHNVECKVFERFRGLDVLPLPKVWYTREASRDAVGVILMEDLSVHGTTPGFICTLTLQQVKNAMRHIVAFHKYQLCLVKTEWAKWAAIPHHRRFWIDDVPGKNRQMLLDIIAGIPEFQEGIMVCCEKTTSFLGEMKALVDKYLPCISTEFAQYALIDRPKQLGLPFLFLHGDTGPHNTFFEKAPDGTVGNEITAFIDWQLSFLGNPMFDVARILFMFCDPEIRREAEETVVEDYHRLLQDEMAKEGETLSFTVEAVSK